MTFFLVQETAQGGHENASEVHQSLRESRIMSWLPSCLPCDPCDPFELPNDHVKLKSWKVQAVQLPNAAEEYTGHVFVSHFATASVSDDFPGPEQPGRSVRPCTSFRLERGPSAAHLGCT